MNTEPKMDKLEERVAARRAAYLAEQAQAGQPAPAVSDTATASAAAAAAPETHISASTAVPLSNPNLEPKIAEAREAMAAGANPLKIARILSEILTLGILQKDLAVALDVKKWWLSKKLGLLTAPAKVQQLIEAGGLSESEYHNNKNVALQIKGRAGTLEYRRMPTVTINIEAAKSLVAILQLLAEQHGASPIHLKPDASKKDITSILTYRAADLLEMIK